MAKNISSGGLAQAVQERAQQPARAHHRYEVPVGLSPTSDPITSVTLVELTAKEERMAARRSGDDRLQLAYELAKASLVEVNDKAIDHAGAEADIVWDRMPPRVRNLVLQAYASLHAPPDDAVEGFLLSHQVRV